MKSGALPIILLLVELSLSPPLIADVYRASSLPDARATVAKLEPGDTLLLASGNYDGSLSISNLRGKPGNPITISGDEGIPPVIQADKEGLHLSNCAFVVVKSFVIKGARYNGVNIDDGGTYDTPAHHIVVADITIEDTGPQGNFDALKMSGVQDFVVQACRISGWGGQSIDLVGCHQGVIEDCVFEGKEGYSQHTGIQCKGGSSHVLIQSNFFRESGMRAVNLGGSTDPRYFRPLGADYEAKDIEVAGNIFIGSETPIAFVTSVNGNFHHNTIIRPGKWIARILQEQSTPALQPCRNGVFAQNLVVFDSNVRTFVNVSTGTKSDTFSFEKNVWFDEAGNRTPELPVPENRGIYGIDPEVTIEGNRVLIGSKDSRFAKVGAHAIEQHPPPDWTRQ